VGGIPARRRRLRLQFNHLPAYRVVKSTRLELKQTRKRTPGGTKFAQPLHGQLSDYSSYGEATHYKSPIVHHPGPRRRIEVQGPVLLWEGSE